MFPCKMGRWIYCDCGYGVVHVYIILWLGVLSREKETDVID
jgi:hypothetical protein